MRAEDWDIGQTPPMALGVEAAGIVTWELAALDEPRHEDRTAIEVRYRVIDRQALRGVVLPLQEPQDRGVTLDAGPRTSRRKGSGDPRLAVTPIDSEDVGLVHAELGRRDGVDAVAIPEMGEKPRRNGLVVHSRAEALQIHQRLGVALPSLPGVAPDNLLEAGVLGHGQASPSHPRPPVTRRWKMACDIDDREGESPLPMEPRVGRMFHSSATGRPREPSLPEALGLCQAASPTR